MPRASMVLTMNRWVLRIQGLEQKRKHYEDILQQELREADDEFNSLRFLSQELQIRIQGIRFQKKNAA